MSSQVRSVFQPISLYTIISSQLQKFHARCQNRASTGPFHLPPRYQEDHVNHHIMVLVANEVREYVAACPICASNMMSHTQPAGLLRYKFLTAPGLASPWTLSLGFPTQVTLIKKIIPTVVDRFTKMAHFIPLLKLTSADETVEAQLTQLFCLCPKGFCFRSGTPVRLQVLARVLQAGGDFNPSPTARRNG